MPPDILDELDELEALARRKTRISSHPFLKLFVRVREMKAALEWYGTPANYDTDGVLVEDQNNQGRGKRACRALGKE